MKNKSKKKSPPKKSTAVVPVDSEKIGKKTDVLNTDTIVIYPDVPEVVAEDEVTVIRDIMTMTDDERFSEDDNTNLSSIRLSPAPRPTWDSDPKNVRFTNGQLVVRRGKKSDMVYLVSSPTFEKDYYVIIPSKSNIHIKVHVDEIKSAPKDAKWIKYWDTIPVIKAPSWQNKSKPPHKPDVKKKPKKR